MDKSAVGKSILEHRERTGLSLRSVAAQLGTYPSNLHRYEHGKVTPELPLLWKLADFYGVSLDELIGRKI